MNRSWIQNTWLFLLVCLALPAVGLILLWMRSGMGIWKKLLGSLVLAGLTLGHLVAFYGLRFEMDGTGMIPFFTFGGPEKRYEAVEAHRAEQRKIAPAELTPTPAPPREDVVEAAAKPASPAAPAAPSVPATFWTDFRGPKRDGHYTQAPILTEWPRGGLKRLWKQPVGGGYASFVVGEGKAFTIEQRRDKEFVTAYDVETGREAWAHSYPANFQESMGGDGPRATPTYHDGSVYSMGATGKLFCLDARTGKVKWSKDVIADTGSENLQWGMAGSPLVVDEKLIVQSGGTPGKAVVAYERLTGKPLWKVLGDKQAYVSPMLVTLGGKRQIVTITARRAVGLAVEDGALLWEFPWVTEYDVNSAQPLVIDGEHLFVSSGYGHGGALLEIKASGAKLSVKQAWMNNRMKNKFSSSVLHEGHIYGMDEAILACVDARTGDLKWKGGRYGYGQVLLADGHLVITTERGDVALVKATPERHQEVAQFSAISGKTWNVPAIDGGRLFVRNAEEMACFQIGK
jgi:outer membrane protein assembly factor BamB